MIRRTIALLCGLLAVGLVALSQQPAGASTTATVYQFQGYDLTQTKTPCGGSYPACHSPLVSAASYVTTTMNSRTAECKTASTVEFICFGNAVSPVAGQTVGVMCWTAVSDGTIFDKIDARFTGIQQTGSALWIGYVDDAFVNLTYGQRTSYVPHC